VRIGTISYVPLEALERLKRNLSPVERACFYVFAALLTIASLTLLARLNGALLVEVPRRGGSLTEGLVGTPRFINPLFALSEPERDLTGLVYAGLLKPLPDGSLAPELAETMSVSNDGLSYTLTIRESAIFHDGSPVRAEDVVFTVSAVEDSRLKSPKRPSWDGVRVEALGEREVRFTLAKPYASFPETLTIGILPAHLWRDFDPDTFLFSTLMTEPVGAGPFRTQSIDRDRDGVPRSYTLRSFDRYVGGEPYLGKLRLNFYPNESALLAAFAEGDIDALGSVPPLYAERLEAEGSRLERAALPRIFAVFFNQNSAPIFAEREVRAALEAAIDKRALVTRVLSGFGVPALGPIPPGLLERDPGESASESEPAQTADAYLARAREILEAAGWKRNPETLVYEKRSGKTTKTLEFSLATADSAELKEAAMFVRDIWERLGTKVTLAVFDMSALQHDIIQPREYDALLFGEVVGRDLDLYAFWHSSQRADPGLNVALYASITADKLLEEARTLSDAAERAERYRSFEKEIANDRPAVFLYVPEFIYIVPKELGGLELGVMMTSSERFLNVEEWYVEREKVWPFFFSQK
jgi:peptide/nickel transport system substrate-binding protein